MKRFGAWTRDLHLYMGLFTCPIILVFAASTVLLNHPGQPAVDAALIYLHKMPAPPNAKIRGNWIYIVWWRLLADTTVYALLFLTASGLYLWWMLTAERKIGWVLLGAGLFVFLLRWL